jgi:hypothetical protein
MRLTRPRYSTARACAGALATPSTICCFTITSSTLRVRRYRERRREGLRLLTLEMPEPAIETAIARGFLKPEETTQAYTVTFTAWALPQPDGNGVISGGKLQTSGSKAVIDALGGTTDVFSGVTVTSGSLVEINDGGTLTLFFLTSGDEVPLRVATGYGDLKINSALIATIHDEIARNEIDVAVFDPLVTLHNVSENDPGKMDSVVGAQPSNSPNGMP